MKTSLLVGIQFIALLAVISITSPAFAQSDLCSEIDRKPVLSTQQITQAELVHYIVVIAGYDAPSPDGKTPEEYYQQELSILISAGYPPALKGENPDRLVTRRYYASIIFQIAKETDPAFATRYRDCTDEQCKINALVDSGWMHVKRGTIYREEILSVLCSKDIRIRKAGAVIEIEPVLIMGAELEAPASPI